jgi:hypothetical protein
MVMTTNHYESLRCKAVTSIRNQEYRIFSNYGMMCWLETISKYSTASITEKTPQLNMSSMSDSLQNQATDILTDMVFYCLKSMEAQ